VLGAKFTSGSSLPIDQPGILAALGPEGSPGYSTVPKGYAGLWAAPDDNAAVVWTNLSEGYLYSYRPEHGSTPTRFTLVARPASIGVSGIDAPIPGVRGYFLNESGKIRATYVHREATAGDPEISSLRAKRRGLREIVGFAIFSEGSRQKWKVEKSKLENEMRTCPL